jgi:hypothetical protein
VKPQDFVFCEWEDSRRQLAAFVQKAVRQRRVVAGLDYLTSAALTIILKQGQLAGAAFSGNKRSPAVTGDTFAGLPVLMGGPQVMARDTTTIKIHSTMLQKSDSVMSGIVLPINTQSQSHLAVSN